MRQVQQFGHGGLGGVGGEPPVSVAAVAARCVDRLQLLEVETGDRLQLLHQPRSFEVGRKVVKPGAVFVLHIDDGYRRRPPPRPRPCAQRRRCRGCAALPTQNKISRDLTAY